LKTIGGVIYADPVLSERESPIGRVAEAVGVAKERIPTGGRIGAAGIVQERILTQDSVLVG
jgi:hypothetical protein